MLENKLGLTSSAELARMEEQLSKKKAVLLFEKGILDSLPAGKFFTLQAISCKEKKEPAKFYFLCWFYYNESIIKESLNLKILISCFLLK